MTPPGRADFELLLPLYRSTTDSDQASCPPWTWSTLLGNERAALVRLVDQFVDDFNHVYATTEDDLIPRCWPHHPGLAYELATHLWLWYAAHLDPATTPAVAGDYYIRHLPAFRQRLTVCLGRSPAECRRGHHPRTWRSEIDGAVTAGPRRDEAEAQHAVAAASAVAFRFPVRL